MSEDILIPLIAILVQLWAMYLIFNFFTGGRREVKPIIENIILDSSNSKLRSFRIGKSMNKVEPSGQSH